MFIARLQTYKTVVENCQYTSDHGRLDEETAMESSHRLLRDAAEKGGIVYVVGNGGSAGIASHFSVDLLKALGVPSQTLYDSNMMTCLGNDLGYENIFATPLKVLMKPEDVLVAISSSGQSPNILKACHIARDRGASVITLSGFLEDNPLRSLGEVNFWLDCDEYGLVEGGHFFLLHTLIDYWNGQPKSDQKQMETLSANAG